MKLITKCNDLWEPPIEEILGAVIKFVHITIIMIF